MILIDKLQIESVNSVTIMTIVKEHNILFNDFHFELTEDFFDKFDLIC